MNHSQSTRRFRSNPIEVAIFSVMAVILAHSVYNLLYDHPGFDPKALTPMTANPISEGRSLASVSQTLLTLPIGCKVDSSATATTSSKVRITGTLCTDGGTSLGAKLIKSTLQNTSNQFHATIFTDNESDKFSTDYIPLNTGSNTLKLEFSYFDGRKFTQEITLNKN